MKRILSAVLTGLVLCLPTACFAQVKVFVSSTTPDSVGGRLVYGIKEGIRRSSGMTIVELESDALISLRIVTLDPDSGATSTGNRTIYSLVWTANTFHENPVEMYLTNSVGLCGTKRVAECADDLVADTDKWASRVLGWIQEAARKE